MNLIILQAGKGFDFQSLFLIGAMAIFMIFFIILPQRKKQKEAQKMQNELKTGDKILTSGGFHASIISVEADAVMIELARGTNVKMDKSAIVKVFK